MAKLITLYIVFCCRRKLGKKNKTSMLNLHRVAYILLHMTAKWGSFMLYDIPNIWNGWKYIIRRKAILKSKTNSLTLMRLEIFNLITNLTKFSLTYAQRASTWFTFNVNLYLLSDYLATRSKFSHKYRQIESFYFLGEHPGLEITAWMGLAHYERTERGPGES